MHPLINYLRAWDASIRESPVAIHSSTSSELKAVLFDSDSPIAPLHRNQKLHVFAFVSIQLCRLVVFSEAWCRCSVVLFISLVCVLSFSAFIWGLVLVFGGALSAVSTQKRKKPLDFGALIRWSAWDTSMYGILSPVPISTSWELKLCFCSPFSQLSARVVHC